MCILAYKMESGGAIEIPMEYVQALKLKIGETLDLEIQDNQICLERYTERCAVCGYERELKKIGDIALCRACATAIACDELNSDFERPLRINQVKVGEGYTIVLPKLLQRELHIDSCSDLTILSDGGKIYISPAGGVCFACGAKTDNKPVGRYIFCDSCFENIKYFEDDLLCSLA